MENVNLVLCAGYQDDASKAQKNLKYPREHVIFMLKICINFTLVYLFECAGLDVCGAAINYTGRLP
jgi:hypothetical protein